MGIKQYNENPITNQEKYTKDLKASLEDKLYFLKYLDNNVNLIIDYGCADGSLILSIAADYPFINFIGYDINPDMIKQARKIRDTYYSALNNVDFVDDIKVLYSDIEATRTGDTALILSSVIHEVYSYGNGKEINDFWDFVFDNNFTQIFIRELCISNEMIKTKIFYEDERTQERFFRKFSSQRATVELFKKIWGPINSMRTAIHFAMKSQWFNDPNVLRELHEDYLPLTLERYLNLIKERAPQYEITLLNHYILPYFYDYLKSIGFDNLIDIAHTNTHLKLILTLQ